jgi:Protein of unknown function (DUF4231)
MADAATATDSRDSTFARLDDQIYWYSAKSRAAQRVYKRIKVVEIVAAPLIPFVTGMRFQHAPLISGGLGVLVTILEGILQLNQYPRIWVTYRVTAEALKTEKYLFLALAGPYSAKDVNPPVLLAERVEDIMARQNTQWDSTQQQSSGTHEAGR